MEEAGMLHRDMVHIAGGSEAVNRIFLLLLPFSLENLRNIFNFDFIQILNLFSFIFWREEMEK